ncbi:hypothetical protein FCV25MIE_12961 [Fagus crenata]
MGRENWLSLGQLKKAVKKLRFLLSFNLSQWRLASIIGSASKRRRRLSFNDRPGLHGCIEDEMLDRNSSAKGIQRTRSYGSEDDIDKRADIFIANFRRQLRLERQVSLELRYYRGTSFKSDEDN